MTDTRAASDDEPDHTEDPRSGGVADGGYPETQQGAAEGRRHREDGSPAAGDGDPGQATGNPHAAGADPRWAADEAEDSERGDR